MVSSYKCEILILCCTLGFSVNSFDGLPQLGAVGPVVYVLNEFSPLSSLVIRCVALEISSFVVDSRGEVLLT